MTLLPHAGICGVLSHLELSSFCHKLLYPGAQGCRFTQRLQRSHLEPKSGLFAPTSSCCVRRAATVPSERGCVGCGAGAHQMCWVKMPLSRAPKAGAGFSPLRVTPFAQVSQLGFESIPVDQLHARSPETQRFLSLVLNA